MLSRFFLKFMVDGFTAVSFCKIQIIFITLKEKGKQNTWE